MPSVRVLPNHRSPYLRRLASRAEPAPLPGVRRLGGRRSRRDCDRAGGPCRRRRGNDLSQRDDLSDDGRRAPGRSARDRRRKGSRSPDRPPTCTLSRAGATRIVDLQGRALFPGFIDPHHHTVLSALFADSDARHRLPEIRESRRRASRAESSRRENTGGPMDRTPVPTTTSCRAAICRWRSWTRSRPGIRFSSST